MISGPKKNKRLFTNGLGQVKWPGIIADRTGRQGNDSLQGIQVILNDSPESGKIDSWQSVQPPNDGSHSIGIILSMIKERKN